MKFLSTLKTCHCIHFVGLQASKWSRNKTLWLLDSGAVENNKHRILNFPISVGFKGVLHPWALFLKTLRIFSKNKTTSDKVFYGSGQKCSKELKNHSFTLVETIVVTLQ